MFPSTGRYDRTMKRDKINKQLPTTPMQKGHQQLNYGLPMDNSRRHHHQQLIDQQKSQLWLDDDKYFLLNIIKAHEETCDYTKDKATSLIEKSRKNPIYARCSTLMSCPLNPLPPPPSGNDAGGNGGGISNNRGEDGGLEDFSERFSPAIRGVVEFAKRIPGFGLLSQDDQVTLLKAGVFEVLLVRLAFMFDKATDSMICLNGMVLKRDSLHSQAAARHLLDSMFAFAERLNGLNLTDTEIALFCSMVVISPDRPGLQNIELVGKINRKCVDLLNQSIKANHHSSLLFDSLINKIADLRTLNTLHSEKLLACKMGPKNGQSYNNLSSTSPSPSPISSSSSTSSLSSLNHHNGNSNSNSSNGDRNCNSPGNMNNSSNCSYASLLPVQWQNFTIRDTNDGSTSSSTSSTSSHSPSSRLTNQSNNSTSYGLADDNLSSYDRNSVTSSDHILTKTIKSANGLSNNQYSNAENHHNGHNQQTGSSLANHFILGQRLLQSSNNNTNSSSSNSVNTNGNSIRDMNNGSSRDSPINSLNHHHGRYHDHHSHHHYDNYCTNNGSSDVFTKMRRVDSPTDSGIESGKEQCNGSTPTASVCSSPRSACGDKVKDIVSDSECSTISEKNIASESIDDMPMLKRALQAPPLINTNMLMDEAYRHHKKFRATKASRDCEPASSSTNIVHSSNGNPNHCLASPTSTSSSSSLSSSTSSLSSACLSPASTNTITPNNCDSLASTHSTLIKVLESAPRYIGDLSHNQQATSRHPSSSPPHLNNNNYTSLPKCDLLHNLIMKGSGSGVNGANNDRRDRMANQNGEGGTIRVGDSMPPPLDLSRKRDLLYL